MNTSDVSLDVSLKGHWSRPVGAVLTVLFIIAPLLALQVFGLGVFRVSASGEDRLPVSIRASSQADYSRDSQTFMIPPIDEDILDQIIIDLLAANEMQDRWGDLPADSVTPAPTRTVNALTSTPTPTATRLPVTLISTLISQTSVPSVIPINTATAGIIITPTTGSVIIPTTLPTRPPTNTSLPPDPISTVVSIPSLVPTVLPLPTLPPVLPTIPPLVSTIPPLIPTIISELPSLPPLLP